MFWITRLKFENIYYHMRIKRRTKKRVYVDKIQKPRTGRFTLNDKNMDQTTW
ncbi:hypothetical protein Hanom_Chr15g01404861 [Helianthus anomalus]